MGCMRWRPWGSALFARQVPDNVYCQGVGFTPWRGSGSGRIYTAQGSDVPSSVPRALLLFAWQAWNNKNRQDSDIFYPGVPRAPLLLRGSRRATHSLAGFFHVRTQPLTHLRTHVLYLSMHTDTDTHPPSMLHYTQTSCSLLAFLCSLADVWETQSHRRGEFLLITDSSAGLLIYRYVVPVFSVFFLVVCDYLSTFLPNYLPIYHSTLRLWHKIV